MKNTQDNHFVPGLDGLRAFAILFIAAYHFSFGWAGGGFLGVDIFFVLSGYLITNKLLSLREDKLGLDLRMFWKRRITRLLPSAYAVIIAVAAFMILFNQELFENHWGDAASSIFNLTNWWFIFHKLSYFDSFGLPSPLKHLWFLAVEEQFLLIWSIVLMAGRRFVNKREVLLVFSIICALCSALLMGLMYNPDTDPSRVYFGTDTRAFELLTGSILAIVLPVKKLLYKKTIVWQKKVLNIVGLVAFGIFILSAVLVNEFQPFLYRGGFLLFAVNAAVLIVCICYQGSFLGKILSWKPLRWIGSRSYGIYLWHYPIFVLSTPVYEIGNPVLWRVGLQLAVTCITAELTYRLIEMPIQKLGFRGFCKRYLTFKFLKWGRLSSADKITAVMALLVVAYISVGITGAAMSERQIERKKSYPYKIAAGYNNQAAEDTEVCIVSPKRRVSNLLISNEANVAGNSSAIPEKKTEAGASGGNTAYTVKKDEVKSAEKNPAFSPAANNSFKEILAIGDSIMLDIEPYLKKKYNNITIDGKVARNMSATAQLSRSYERFNSPDKAVILQLGTNGSITEKQIDFVLNVFTKANVYLVNTRVPRSWEKADNKILKEKAEERENVTLVDWYSLAIEHPEYFGKDGVHLKSIGSQALTNLIGEALNSK